jgi:TRAP-type mannitol/chloroaromatic compound transport system permease large subunit
MPFVAMVVALLLGVPIAVALAGSGILGIWLVRGDWDIVIGVLKTATLAAADYNLTTVPMFILMAYFSSASGLATDLYTAASRWLSPFRGGLAIATVAACAVFGALCGGSVAAAAVMSNIAYPNMRRLGYSDVLSAGVGVGRRLSYCHRALLSFHRHRHGDFNRQVTHRGCLSRDSPGNLLDSLHCDLGECQAIPCS